MKKINNINNSSITLIGLQKRIGLLVPLYKSVTYEL